VTEILFQAHSGLRYLVLLAGLVALVLLLMLRFAGEGSDRAVSPGARIASASFAGLLDLQVLLGVVLVFLRPWNGALIGHVAMMVLALIALHLFRVAARRAQAGSRQATFLLLSILLPLVLIVGGILAIGRPIV
jgi:hypothetical protein